MKLEYTNRGFGNIEFEDTYGHKCSIQESSNMSHLWVGVDDVNPQIMAVNAKALGIPTHGQNLGWMDYEIPKEVLLHSRMHLSVSQAQELVDELQNWIKTGSLEKKTSIWERILNFFS